MKKEDLLKLKDKIIRLSEEDSKKRDLYLRDISLDKVLGPQIGYASVDKPWLKYYNENIFDVNIPNLSAYEFMLESNKNNLDKVALTYFGKKYSYRQLFNIINVVENSFRNMGVKQGDIVSIAIPNVPENVFIFYALNKIGAVANFIDLRLKNEALIDAINSVKSEILVGCDLFLKNVCDIIDDTNLKKVVVVSPSDSLLPFVKQLYSLSNKTFNTMDNRFIKWNKFLKNNNNYDNIIENDKSDIEACILHTSGTTGKSKGVVLSNYALNSMAMQYRYIGIDYNNKDKFMNQVPPFLAYNIILSTHMPLCMGLNIVMLPNYEPDKFAEHIMKYKINHVLAGPADWTNFLENEKIKNSDLSYLSTMGSGSDKINSETKNKIDDLLASRGVKYKILEGYGMTEVGSAACSSLRNINVLNSVGVPLPFMTIGIFDPNTNGELPYNTDGEICIKGPTMMNGYYNDKEATDETIKLHSDNTLWVHTGDIGHIDQNGVLYLSGRMKRIIVRHDGIKISPFEIERVVEKIPNVKACCTVAINDIIHGSGSVPCINVIPEDTNLLNEEELKELILKYCKQELTDKYCIEKINVVPSFPLTPVGKVDYIKLSNICNESNAKILKKI